MTGHVAVTGTPVHPDIGPDRKKDKEKKGTLSIRFKKNLYVKG